MAKKLEKNDVLYGRDGDGELIAQERPLVIDENDERQAEYDDCTVAVIPLTRGEIRKMFGELETNEVDADRDKDGEIIVNNCKRPVFTLEEVKFSKPGLTSAIVNTILYESGLEVKGVKPKDAAKKKETEFSKNLDEPNPSE